MLLKSWRAAPPRVFGHLYLDLDGFKIINDNFWSSSGDELIQAGCWGVNKGSIPSGALFCIAWGGDEFVVVLENIDSRLKIRKHCKKY